MHGAHERGSTHLSNALDSIRRRDAGSPALLADRVLSLIYGVALGYLRDPALAGRAAETAALAVWSNSSAGAAAGPVAERYVRLVALQHAERVRVAARTTQERASPRETSSTEW